MCFSCKEPKVSIGERLNRAHTRCRTFGEVKNVPSHLAIESPSLSSAARSLAAVCRITRDSMYVEVRPPNHSRHGKAIIITYSVCVCVCVCV